MAIQSSRTYSLILLCIYFSSELDQHASTLISKGLAFNSRRSYSSATRKYLNFCAHYCLDPCELNEHTLLRFITYLSLQHLSIRTIRVYLSGLRAWIISSGHPPPVIYTPRVKWALRALQRHQPEPAQAHPITYQVLEKLQKSLDFSYNSLMQYTAMTTGYFGCLRASEYCFNPDVSPPLLRSSVRFHRAATPYMTLLIASSKTSLKSFTVVIGCSHASVCAHCNMLHYLQLNSAHSASPLFSFLDGTPLTHRTLSRFIKKALARVGLKHQQATPHSLRAGAATDGASRLPTSADVQKLGRWKSDAYLNYIRPSQPDQAKVAAILAQDW